MSRSTTDVDRSSDVPDDLRGEIERLGPWFHNLHLPGGVETAPDHPLGDFPRFKWEAVAPHLPDDLSGRTALDVGCNAGFYTFELAKRGARVVGVDHDEHYLAQARWASERFGLADRVELRKQDVYDLGRSSETYDLVLFLGVLYHLRYPLLGLDAVARTVDETLVFQSLMMPGDAVREDTDGYGLDEREVLRSEGWPRMAFLEHEFEGDPTNWWAPNAACVEAMLRSTGLEIVGRPEPETYLCRPAPPGTFWRIDEMRTALGRRSDASGERSR